jgi:ubiquinone/menaquinone biosynthesis C-methylase UbiE
MLDAQTQMAVAYEQHLVPHVFEPWAHLLVDRLALEAGWTLVDVATGPGTIARLASIRLGGRGRVIATDISRTMLMLAQQRTGLPGVAQIDYAEGPASPLPVPDGVADLVVCQQGLQFFPDKPAALREMRRVLKPRGRIGVSVWAELATSNIASAVHAALKDSAPQPLAEAWKTSFTGPTPAELRELAEGARFVDVSVERMSAPVVFEGGTEQVLAALWGTPLAPGMAELGKRELFALQEAVRKKLGPLIKGQAVEGKLVAHLLLARR